MNYYLFVVRPENWKKLKSPTTSMWGFSDYWSSSLSGAKDGDKAVIYVSKIGAFAAVATLTGRTYRVDKNPLWLGDVYPVRIPLKFETILEDKGSYVPIEPLLPKLTSISGRPSLQASVRRLPEEDFRLICDELMKKYDEFMSKAAPHEQTT